MKCTCLGAFAENIKFITNHTFPVSPLATRDSVACSSSPLSFKDTAIGKSSADDDDDAELAGVSPCGGSIVDSGACSVVDEVGNATGSFSTVIVGVTAAR